MDRKPIGDEEGDGGNQRDDEDKGWTDLRVPLDKDWEGVVLLRENTGIMIDDELDLF